MSQAHGSWSHDFLSGGLPGADTEASYDAPAAHLRLMAVARCPVPVAEPTGVAAGEEAAKALDALCEQVVFDVQASRRIALLAGGQALATGGAFAFGCVLHLAGEEEGATFWWQFAAGTDDAEAAYCLMLDHHRRAELEDAQIWRERLAQTGYVADDGWRDRAAVAPELRRRLNHVARYTHAYDHEDLGPVVMPTPRLAKALLSLALAGRPDRRPGQGMPQFFRTAATATAAAVRPPVPGVSSAVQVSAPSSNRRDGEAGGNGGSEGDEVNASPGQSDNDRPVTPETDAGLGAPTRGGLWLPPGVAGDTNHTPSQWEDSLRILDVLHLVRETRSVSVAQVARAAGTAVPAAASLMVWLADNSLTRPLGDGLHGPGPLLTEIDSGHNVLQAVLDQLRDDTGAAVYVSTYTDGEVCIPHRAFGPNAPQVTITADFRESTNAHAVGKSLISQLTPDQRKDLLSRRPPVSLTKRTITDTDILFDTIDRYGPQGAHFDVLEYSDAEVCAAISLPLPGQACSIALSRPAADRGRLISAAAKLSNRSTGLLLALLLAHHQSDTTPSTPTAPEPPTAESRLWRPRPGLSLPPSLNGRLTPSGQLLMITPR
ncbi:IclR family transcriptional regulator C-terminal domain-containing protein [Streptomyces virginiae]|uniref:IclR family transcriptional regulator domain-containing protein n=1 Tax=Streptomyces virginiae TaxID=1961 RepID=UPI00381380A7